jgi:hypothetical protein
MQKGTHQSEESKAKISATRKERGYKTFTGKTHTEYARNRQSEGMKAYWAKKKGEQQ